MALVLERHQMDDDLGSLGLAALAGLALALAAAVPDAKFQLDVLGASPGSSTRGLGLYAAELAAWALGAATLASRAARRRIPSLAAGSAALWCLALAWGAWQGRRLGADTRDILAECRSALLAPALLGLSALTPRGWRVALAAGSWGLLVGVLMRSLLLVLEPTGQVNMNLVPVPVLMLDHDLPWMLLLAMAALALLLRQAAEPRALRAFTLLLLGLLAWLSFLRSLWAALAVAAVAAVLGLWLGRQPKLGWRAAAWMGVLAVVSFALALGLQRAVTPDGDYLLRFRLLRLSQQLHLAAPPEERPVLGPPNSALFKAVALRGGLYRNLSGAPAEPSAAQQRQQDPSAVDRGLMRRLAWQAFLQHPWGGWGLGSLLRYSPVPGVERLQRDPHMGYAWLLKCGALGMLAGGALLFIPLLASLQGLRRRCTLAGAWALAALGLLASAELFHAGFLQVPSLMAWALAAAAPLRPTNA